MPITLTEKDRLKIEDLKYEYLRCLSRYSATYQTLENEDRANYLINNLSKWITDFYLAHLGENYSLIELGDLIVSNMKKGFPPEEDSPMSES